MKKIAIRILGLLLFFNTNGLAQTATLNVPPSIDLGTNQTVQIPLTISTSETIGLGQFVLNYNATILTYLSAEIGPDAAGFVITAENKNLPFPPTTPGATDNVLIQISGGGNNSVTGSDQVVLNLNFMTNDVAGGSPVAFDKGTNRTFLTTSGLIDLRGNDLTFGIGILTDLEHFMPGNQLPEVYIAEVFPNPFVNQLNLTVWLNKSGRLQMKLFTLDGKVLSKRIMEGNTGKNTFSILMDEHSSSGLFFLKLQDEHGNTGEVWVVGK